MKLSENLLASAALLAKRSGHVRSIGKLRFDDALRA
jgi:hypothetical protein